MSTKYIGQINNQSFVYPNKTLAEYDIDIIHDLNDNSVSGFSTTFSATTITTSSITVSYNLTWVKNNAEPFINNAGLLSAISIHMLGPNQLYFKPWRAVHSLTSSSINSSTLNFTGTFTVTPADLGLVSFGSGEIYYEIRFIGHRSIFPICYSSTSTVGPTPTPTPTLTPTPTTTGPTPTPTLTPTLTPTPTATSSFPQTIFVSGIQAVCGTFCGGNYLINTSIGADNVYLSLSLGDNVDLYVAGFYAYSSANTDTTTGPFRIMEIDALGVVQDILVCSGASCVPL
jgi:hypothetical protein